MYESMKAKDAAKVFDRLNMRVLIEVVNAMNPRRMSDILGQMTPDVAERLTLEIANRSGAVDKTQRRPNCPRSRAGRASREPAAGKPGDLESDG